jgi:predicted ribosome-associated RNA-binding protein Tma20
MKRYHLRKDEIRKLSEKLSPELEEIKRLFKRGEVEVLELAKGENVISVGGKPVFIVVG